MSGKVRPRPEAGRGLLSGEVSLRLPPMIKGSGGVDRRGSIDQGQEPTAGGPVVGLVMVLLSRVTAAVRARTRPSMVTPVVTVIDANAITVPRIVEWVPSVAELPTCQKTLPACAPLIRFTPLAEAVMRVDAVLKMNTAPLRPAGQGSRVSP